MCGKMLKIPIKPFVENIIQRFYCYGYGHWKDKRKKEKKFLVCGEGFHSQCNKREKCINCGKESIKLMI